MYRLLSACPSPDRTGCSILPPWQCALAERFQEAKDAYLDQRVDELLEEEYAAIMDDELEEEDE